MNVYILFLVTLFFYNRTCILPFNTEDDSKNSLKLNNLNNIKICNKKQDVNIPYLINNKRCNDGFKYTFDYN